jgi:two-component system, chemotaxis family, protein-glutamate methylesterase/glutaminase
VYAYGLQYRRSLSPDLKKQRDSTRTAPSAAEPGEPGEPGEPLQKQKPLQRTIVPEVLRFEESKGAAGQAAREVASPVSRNEAGPLEICAIGISTGGPNALRAVFSEFPGDFPLPVLVVQHMPPGFTREFARSLDKICALEVKEAEEGDIVKVGRILIAPGNYHIKVNRKRLATIVSLSSDDVVNGHRPSADVLFESVAQEFGGKALAVIMTGMGKDGALKIGEIHRQGGITIAQDAVSSIVYGMPRVAAELGHIQHIVGLKEMASAITAQAREHSFFR